MFGKPKKRQNDETKSQKQIDRLEKQVKELELQLKKINKERNTTQETPKQTESQNTVEDLKRKEINQAEEIETIFHEEDLNGSNEPEYIMLKKPIQQRQKSIDILEKEAVKEVNLNRREIIKKKIEEELKQRELGAKELKILFVDELEYCSKATFYRYLESLRKEQRIDSIKINGKEYLCSIASKNNF